LATFFSFCRRWREGAGLIAGLARVSRFALLGIRIAQQICERAQIFTLPIAWLGVGVAAGDGPM